MQRRWIITVTAVDGTESAWGPWRDSNTAEHLANRLRDRMPEEDNGETRITLLWVERWPGLEAAVAELS